MRCWDIQPYVSNPDNRLVRMYKNIRHDHEKLLLKCGWSQDGTKVGVGSSDKFVYVFDSLNTKLLYQLPGHNGAVTEVDFHPKEPIILSCGTDKQIYLGELAKLNSMFFLCHFQQHSKYIV
eukprot:TRINITY_DN1726_c0_g1_i1.p1 TRINITY_DN1726_c0_g1~~TRINITY_DN1726_c0_g1_i1.p1  ORF type:complete len:141 (+),score=19.92 TRINITY_DN1726_c0_g1_i1:62-424(+)